MLVATTRRPAANPGELYSGERGGLSFANVVVSIPPDSARETGEIQWPKTSPGNPATDFVATGVSRLDSGATRTWLELSRLGNKHRVLIFVHGYNNRFNDAVFRAAQLIHDSDAGVTPILFTWPSRGSLLAYGYDRESANLSRDASSDCWTCSFAIPPCARSTSSPIRWAMRSCSKPCGRWRSETAASRIDDVMLAAPDVDVDAFANEIADMVDPHPKFTLFASRDDKALALSGWIWGSDARLGAIDPKAEPYEASLRRSM